MELKPITIKDNTRIEQNSFPENSKLVKKIANKTLKQLEDEGIFVFPDSLENSKDITRDQMILQSVDSVYRTSNVMGFLGCGNERLIIKSRFSSEKSENNDFFLQYLLEKVVNLNIINLSTDANQDEQIFNLLVFLFPRFLKKAMRKGLYKTYIRKKYNDTHAKGALDIARFVKEDTPFLGNIAYNQREYSYDNFVTELIRHAVEFIKHKHYGSQLLGNVKDEVDAIVQVTQQYKPYDRGKIIAENEHNIIKHAYYREYFMLQKLCILILQHQKHNIGSGSQQIYGILFDGAWLWEEYINSLIKDVFYHPMNKGGKDAQQLFEKNIGLIYPDFISRNNENRIIADAKYKPVDNIGNRDYLQVLAYMFRFDAKVGYYLYPEAKETDDLKLQLNRGSTYEKNVMLRDDISVTKHGLKIPVKVQNYKEFCNEMKDNEQEFISVFK